jgi:hypothetical protein
MAARQEHKRENYKPSGAIVLTPKGCKAEIYLFDDQKGRPCAIGFKGRAKKPTFRHWFEQPERRERFVARFIKETTENQKRASQRADQHTLKVDDILVASWGYDQTNIQFFQVVKDAGKNTVHLREIKSKSALRDGENRLAMQDKVVPVVGEFKTGVLKKRVDMSGGNPSVKVGYGAIAWFWDGKPQTQTSYA